MEMRFDVVIVGAGIVGLSHAAAASALGLRVCVIDRSPTPSGASVRNFGLLTQLYNGDAVWGARAARSRELYAAWCAAGALPLHRLGSLQLVQSAAQLTVAAAFAAASPAVATLLDAAAARALCPALRADAPLYGALHFPEDALLEPRTMARSLPAFLAAQRGVAFVWGDAAVALRRGAGGDGAAPLLLATASGATLAARLVILATGDDAAGLLPALLAQEAQALSLVKLQMSRVRLPAGGGGLTMPVTSGLSMRRYPAFGAACPEAYAAMMAEDTAGADPAAEALGIHVIARPAPDARRGAWGGLLPPPPGGGPWEVLRDDEAIIGDSHEVVPLRAALDETVDEGVTDEILRVAGSMLRGVRELHAARVGVGAGAGAGSGADAARMLTQWSGTYMSHAEGVLNVTLTLTDDAGGFRRLAPGDVAAAGAEAGLVHVCTALGGKGMTMSPALAEENIAALCEGVRVRAVSEARGADARAPAAPAAAGGDARPAAGEAASSPTAMLGPRLPTATLARCVTLPLKPAAAELRGEWVTLVPYDEARHLAALHAVNDGRPVWGARAYDWDAALWRFLLSRAFSGGADSAECSGADGRLSLAAFTAQQRARSEAPDRRTWLILLREDARLPPAFGSGGPRERIVGQLSLMNSRPADLAVELGFIAVTPALQRTPVATEACALLITAAVASGYRRVEWKTNVRNVRSAAAALRLGFRHEGVFHSHMIVHDGYSRDTWWAAMSDAQWAAGVQASTAKWLASSAAGELFHRRAAELRGAG